VLSPEVFYDGFGARDSAGLLAAATSRRLAVGEQVLLGRLHAGLVGDLELHPLLHLGGAGIVAFVDPSGLFSLTLRYSVADDVDAVLGGYVPVGRRPTATGALPAPRSEFGLFPTFAFLSLRAVI